ncbi:aminotransferase class I/II-fold pyridoxal phosphate-dependent enzyme [Kiloniella majae]|uniref:aminotransferase class I/II-fold pyridoxal phosphate-dependent enzyme n=1 Tax=Kiloniella majae TaxID=1938558 RepID=UPI001C3F91DF|nr:8-amino-7-oxononanoate synthase [Kiloniella majae]
MTNLSKRIDTYLQAMPDERLRKLKYSNLLEGGYVEHTGRKLLNFASNDYLGLTQSRVVRERAAEWAKAYGSGAGASRLITGNHFTYELIEKKLAELKGAEAALLLNSGFQANSSVLAALLNTRLHGGVGKPEVLLFCDKLNHASLHFGVQAANAKQIRFRHNDLGHLAQLLEKHKNSEQAKIIVTESVFSMDGDQLDVPEIRSLAKRYDAFLYIDEAHATGVLGAKGMGLCAGGISDNELIMGTCGKALGSYGAYIACSQSMKKYLVNCCSGLIYATALPPQVLGAIDAALDLVPAMDSERRHLAHCSYNFRNMLNDKGIDTALSSTQIIPVIIGNDKETLAVAHELEEEGFLVGAIRPPTVPEGSGRLRVTLSAVHTEKQIEDLASVIIKSIAKIIDAKGTV